MTEINETIEVLEEKLEAKNHRIKILENKISMLYTAKKFLDAQVNASDTTGFVYWE